MHCLCLSFAYAAIYAEHIRFYRTTWSYVYTFHSHRITFLAQFSLLFFFRYFSFMLCNLSFYVDVFPRSSALLPPLSLSCSLLRCPYASILCCLGLYAVAVDIGTTAAAFFYCSFTWFSLKAEQYSTTHGMPAQSIYILHRYFCAAESSKFQCEGKARSIFICTKKYELSIFVAIALVDNMLLFLFFRAVLSNTYMKLCNVYFSALSSSNKMQRIVMKSKLNAMRYIKFKTLQVFCEKCKLREGGETWTLVTPNKKCCIK